MQIKKYRKSRAVEGVEEGSSQLEVQETRQKQETYTFSLSEINYTVKANSLCFLFRHALLILYMEQIVKIDVIVI